MFKVGITTSLSVTGEDSFHILSLSLSLSLMEEETQAKWEGEHSTELKGAKAHEIWSLLADFCNLHKWFPIDTCYHVEGVPGQPGLIRYCASTKADPTSSGDSTDDASSTKWVKERLLLIDQDKRVLSYEVLDNNIGFKSYVATIKVLPTNYADDSPGCKIVWSFVCDPIQGWALEDLQKYVDFCLQYMAEKMENFLQKSE